MSVANAKAQEPSMEEILASIRRIIADDQTGKATPEPEPEPSPLPPPRQARAAAPAPALPEVPADTFTTAQPDPLGMFEDAPDAAPVPVPPPVEETSDVLDLADLGEPEPASSFEPDDDVAFADMPAPPPVEPPSPPVSDAIDARPTDARSSGESFEDRLLSQTTDAAVSGAFGSLARTILTHNSRTLEDLVGDMLRPMLKVWLDDNLPVIVERLVRAEIERVARGR